MAAVLALVGLVRLVPALLMREPFGAEPTIALLFVVLGVMGMIRGGTGRQG